MVKFDISKNELYAMGAKALAKALKGNKVMTKLNIADNSMGKISKYGHADMSGIMDIANAIPTMRALVKFDISSNGLWKEGTKAIAGALKDNNIMTELNLADNAMGKDGAMDIAETIPTMGAMVSVNILNNKIGAEQAQNLVTILQEHPTLKSLCGNKGDETELDMSGKEMGADGAIMLAPEIVANGALTSLDISSNNIAPYAGGGKYVMSGVTALAAAIPECK